MGEKLLSSHVLRCQALPSQMWLPRTSKDMAAQLEKSNSHLERNPILRSSLVDWASHGIITRDPDSQTQHSKKAKPEKIFE